MIRKIRNNPRKARASHRISQALNLGKIDSFGPSDIPARPTITRRNNNGYDYDDGKDSDAFIVCLFQSQKITLI